MKKEKSEHKNYIDMEVYLADIKRYRETAETQKMLLDKIVKENGGLKEENKKLKEEIERMKVDTMYDMKDINALYEENKKLKEENRPFKIISETEAIIDLRKRIEDLEELLTQYDPEWNNSLDNNQE